MCVSVYKKPVAFFLFGDRVWRFYVKEEGVGETSAPDSLDPAGGKRQGHGARDMGLRDGFGRIILVHFSLGFGSQARKSKEQYGSNLDCHTTFVIL